MISLIKQQFDEKCRMKVTSVSVCKVSELQECQLTKMSTSESWSLNDYQSHCKNLSISNFFSSGRRKAKQAQQESSMEELRVGKLLKILAIRISSSWKYMKSLILIFINSVVHKSCVFTNCQQVSFSIWLLPILAPKGFFYSELIIT